MLKDHGVLQIKWFSKDNLSAKEECLEGTIEFIMGYYDAKNRK